MPRMERRRPAGKRLALRLRIGDCVFAGETPALHFGMPRLYSII